MSINPDFQALLVSMLGAALAVMFAGGLLFSFMLIVSENPLAKRMILSYSAIFFVIVLVFFFVGAAIPDYDHRFGPGQCQPQSTGVYTCIQER